MIDLSNVALMMIEPQEAATEPIDDVWSWRAIDVMDRCTKGEGRYRGIHTCVCGKPSTNYDLITPQGRTTNSLLVHYVEQHRREIPNSELIKLYAEFAVATIDDATRHFAENESW